MSVPETPPELLCTLYSGFSCPMESLNTGFLDNIVIEHARQYTKILLSQRFKEIRQFSSGILELVLRWSDSDPTFDECWDISVGEITKLFTCREGIDGNIRVTNLALHLLHCGRPGTFEVSFVEPLQLRWGRMLLPQASTLRASSDGINCTFEACLGNAGMSIACQRQGHHWASEFSSSIPEFQMSCNVARILSDSATAGIEINLIGEITEMDTRFLITCEAAIGLLKRCAPAYLPWVDKVMRYVIPLKPMPPIIMSGSECAQPGMLYMSTQIDDIAVAEVFIHECTHHYMHILQRLEPLCDPADTKLYYSPVRRTGRPISGILTAFHAFTNVFLFYRLLEENDACASSYGRQGERRLIQQLKQLESTLEVADSLTPAGRALIKPLSDRLHKQIGRS